MNDNVRAQSPNVESEPMEVGVFRLAEVLKRLRFRKSVCRVNRQVHPDRDDMSLRPDAVVSFKQKLNLPSASSLLVYRL